MPFSTKALLPLLYTASATLAQTFTEFGYTCQPHCITPSIPETNHNLTFGSHYAVLNLDLINIISSYANTTAGKAFVDATQTWINATRAQCPPPLTIYTYPGFSGVKKPALNPQSAFAAAVAPLSAMDLEIDPIFAPNVSAGDVVLEKSRYYAGWGNSLEVILRAQNIDTVILSGQQAAAVVLNTVYTLFNLDYKVYVIANTTIQAGKMGQEIYAATLEGIIPSLPANVITLEQALAALNRSGPAVY